jgi:hypothetical protein
MRVAVNSRSKQQNWLNCFVDNGAEAHNLDMLMTIDRTGCEDILCSLLAVARLPKKNP